jgi:hypothetical protein
MDLPMEQLWFNILLRALITVYSANGIWNFIAYIPWMSKDDAEILGYDTDSNYSFQLTSSLIFCLLWIAQFRFPLLVYLTIAEITLIIVIYLYLIERKLNYMEWEKIGLKKVKKKRANEIKSKMSS